ncbi:MAG: phenylalanine--tRNA ligase subunit beta, partial [Actinobacteria bacterium]|nr:phenylalanine--tRNA ligase subunit beta [Actinomycetota bacterium]
MLCSERELGLGRDQAGIMQLRGDYEPGQPLVEALGLDDYRLVLDVTPNRPDLLGQWGVARELAPGGEADLRTPEVPDAPDVTYEVEQGASEVAGAGVT